MPPNNRESSIAFLSTSGSALHGAPPPDACHLVPWLDRMNFKGGSSGCVGKRSASRLQNNWAFLGNVVPGDFTPALAKHTQSFNLIGTPRLEWAEFRETSSHCSARSNCGGRRKSPTIQRSCSSDRKSTRLNSSHI